MDKIINKYQAICGVVWIVICCILILRPTRFVTENPVVVSNQEISARSEAIKDDNLAAQRFVAPYSHLADIKIYLLNENTGGEFRFILFDADYNPIMDKNVIVEDMEELPGLYTIELNQDVEAGKEYCYMIQGISEEFYVAYEDTAASGTTYNRQLFYCGAEVRGSNIITEYDYELPFGKGKAFACYAAIILLGLLISFLSKKHYEKYPEKNCLLTVEMVWKRVLTPIVVVCAAVCLIAIWPLNMFSAGTDNDVIFNALDVAFYYAGILITAGILLYGINHSRRHKSNDMGLSILRENWTDYLQAIFFALAVQTSVNYMNALYENQHIIAYLKLLIYLGLAVIVTYKRKEIFNRINLLYVIIAAVAGCLYYNAQVTNVETEDEMQILKLIICAVIIAGIVIINTISILLRKQVGGISGYGIVIALFFTLLTVFRNTRGWVIYLVCVFTLYYLRMAAWDKKEHLLQNICNGILLHFLVALGYCLLHRPYLFYIQTRYSFLFHTVTVTAEYLSLVIVAAFVKLAQVYHKEKRFSYIWKELTIFGVSSVYLLITLSRTGYLAIALTMITALPLLCISRRYKAKTFLSMAAMMFVAFIICFPAVFTIQRIVPSVVAKPEMFEFEWIPDEIKETRVTDSRYYITIRRFAQLFENKVLGIPEEKCTVPCKPTGWDDYEDDYAMLVVSAELSGTMISDGDDGIPENDNMETYSSGRLDIFRLYISHLNMTGHDNMEVQSLDGNTKLVHAHNTYIQAAYDHGIPMGIIFTLFIVYTLIQSAVYYNKRNEDRICSLLPFTLTIAFAGAGLTEWIFHPCNPLALGMLLALAPLICDVRGKSYNMVDKV
ncbi:MAG: hypothetical protein NC313_15380 [Butyrivibrio sp.]|nr:hypothetical protein [Butyrivibrio sp.]